MAQRRHRWWRFRQWAGVPSHEPGLLYARTDIGGAYRWNADGRSWQPLMDWLGHDDHGRFAVESLALDPSDPDRVYLAVGTYLHERGQDGAILRSNDRGATFRRTSLPFKLGGNAQGRGNGERLAVDPNDGRVLLFGTRENGLWRSDDGGATWRASPGFPQIATSKSAWAEGWRDLQPIGIAFVVFDPGSGAPGVASKTIYAGVSTSGNKPVSLGRWRCQLACRPRTAGRLATEPHGARRARALAQLRRRTRPEPHGRWRGVALRSRRWRLAGDHAAAARAECRRRLRLGRGGGARPTIPT